MANSQLFCILAFVCSIFAVQAYPALVTNPTFIGAPSVPYSAQEVTYNNIYSGAQVGFGLETIIPGSIQSVLPGTVQTLYPETVQTVLPGVGYQSVIPGVSQSIIPGSVQSIIPGTVQSVYPGAVQTGVLGGVQSVLPGTIQPVLSGNILSNQIASNPLVSNVGLGQSILNSGFSYANAPAISNQGRVVTF